MDFWEADVARSARLSPRWSYRARQALWAVIDFVLPPRCAGCRRAGQRFCPTCQSQLSLLAAPVCAWCGYPVAARDAACVNCQGRSRSALAGIRSAAFFEGPLQNALHQLKYRRDVILADSLARLLTQTWAAAGQPGDLIIPVPLSAQRLRERGYNQAGLLARGFAELSGLPAAPAALSKTRHTVSQVGLTAQQRLGNVQAAFMADPRPVVQRAVILVDDVCTTGATLIAGAEALMAAGARSVWGLTLARAR